MQKAAFMMLVSIISDIHGNLEALKRAIEITEDLRCDQIVCLGDIVGYGPNPDECVSMIRSASDHVVMGNHDHAVFDVEATEKFNDIARMAVSWTRERLQPNNMEYLAGLPLALTMDDVLFVHSTPAEPESWHYVFDEEDAAEGFGRMDSSVCFIGHTHIPVHFSTSHEQAGPVLARDHKHIINVGSVGQPRDGDPRLSFGVFDSEAWTYRSVRAEYDVQTTAEKIRQAGLPLFLAERLLRGR